MKLVDSEITHVEDDDGGEHSTPPRPEHRRVYTSLVVTLGVLIGTVAIVYGLAPKRDNELLTVVLEAHEEPGHLELANASEPELEAWSLGVLGRRARWPTGPELEVVGARRLAILRRPAALVRYRIAGHEVSVVALRPREAVRRKHRKHEDGMLCVSWRKGKLTYAVVGPEASFREWGPVVGVP
jgi:hypothetical protein